MDVAKTCRNSVYSRSNSLFEETGNFFNPSREYQGKIRDLKGANCRFLGPLVGIAFDGRIGPYRERNTTRYLCNKIGLAPAAQAIESEKPLSASVHASPGIPCFAFLSSPIKIPVSIFTAHGRMCHEQN